MPLDDPPILVPGGRLELPNLLVVIQTLFHLSYPGTSHIW